MEIEINNVNPITIMKSKEIKIAITTILAIVLVYLGIMFMKGLKLFSTNNIYYVEMNNVGGLAKSGEVIANGMNIGLVKDITYNSNKQTLAVSIELNEGFTLPKNSYANISKDMLGSPKLNIILGTDPNNLLSIGDTIKGEGGGDLMSSVNVMIPKITALIPKLDSIASAINILANDPSLLASIHNLEYVSNNLKTTTNEVNSILGKDVPKLIKHANSICNNLEVSTSKLNDVNFAELATNANNTILSANSTISEIKIFTNKLNNRNSTIGKLMNDPSVYNNLDSTMNNAALLLEDLRLHPARYVHFSLFGKKAK